MAYLASLPSFLTWFPLAAAFLAGFAFVYARVTPWRELALIKSGNTAAACSFLGALLGYAIVLASILAHAHSRGDLIVWAMIGFCVQIAVLPVAQKLLGADLRQGLEDGKMAIGMLVGGLALSAGVINAAAMIP